MLEELKSFFFFFFIFKEFWAHAVECGVLVAWSEIKPTPLALEARVLNLGPPGKSQELKRLERTLMEGKASLEEGNIKNVKDQ